MATFLEPPPLASVAAVIGLTALSLAIGLSGGSRAADSDQGGSIGTAPNEIPSPVSSVEDDAPPTPEDATGGSDKGLSGGHE